MSSIYAMPGWMGTTFLCAAVLASLAVGVLLAYAVCMGVFEVMHRHAGLAWEPKESTAVVAPAIAVEG